MSIGQVIITRKPTTSEMAISSQVKSSVTEATTHLREALAFAARVEHPLTIHNLTEVLMRLESLEAMEEMLTKYGSVPSENPN